ncbi:TerL protein [Burkholderia gladioli]|uniref:TerL protein n=1 Tax=Burkholderia gladioli TaxID=28095 RepID=UPI0016422FAB|nr:TerL protein [Burkholderia gladioli]
MAAPDWFDFRSPDYARLYEERAQRLRNMRDQPEIVAGLKAYYRDHPVDFINDWGMTFDPRNAEIGLPTIIPMLLFPKQAEFVEWVVELWKGREDGLAEKSRDMGVSWLCVFIAVWMWLFYPGAVVGFGSRKEEYVDKSGDPKSLFWKIRRAVSLLPIEFLPTGYVESKHAPTMRILNPENGSAIVGEAGDNIGRGNRTSIYFKDESAFYERAGAIDAALSQTSNCKIDVSTVNGNGNPFYTKRHSGKIKVFTFHWRDDPRKDLAWYEKQKATLDPVIVAQEIDIDYNASVSDSWIDGGSVSSAQNNGPAQVEAIGAWRVSVDAAHFGDDESVIHCRKGRLNLPQVFRRKLDGPALAGVVEAECDKITAGGDSLEAIIIELDGPGVSCYDQLRMGKYKQFVVGVHTGTRLSDGKNFNIRSKMWRDARDYLEDSPVSMHNDGEIRSQLASVKYRYKDGMLIMQSKKEYKSEFGKSPDRADAFVLSFVPVKPRRSGPVATADSEYSIFSV